MVKREKIKRRRKKSERPPDRGEGDRQKSTKWKKPLPKQLLRGKPKRVGI